VRAYSAELLAQFAAAYPELSGELRRALRPLRAGASPAVAAALRRALASLPAANARSA